MEKIKNVLMDMDGVLVRGRTAIPGAPEFIEKLNDAGVEYLVLTNNPMHTPKDLAHRLNTTGINIPETRIFTSAIAAARFMRSQRPEGKAFVIGESGRLRARGSAGQRRWTHPLQRISRQPAWRLIENEDGVI